MLKVYTHSQVSFEMIIIFTVILTVITGFLVLMDNRMSDIAEEMQYSAMDNLAQDIKNEIILASSVRDDYMRKFDLPLYIEGLDYNISIDEDILEIVAFDDYTRKEIIRIMPMPVSGRFVDDITYNTTDHCITKKSGEGIKISRNLAELKIKDQLLSDGIYEVQKGSEFEVYVRLNCVYDLTGVQFTLSWDPSMLELLSSDPRQDIIDKENYLYDDPLFDKIPVSNCFNIRSVLKDCPDIGSNLNYQDIDGTGQDRMTYAFVSDTPATGSGNIAKINFKVRDISGSTIIHFDPIFDAAYKKSPHMCVPSLTILDITADTTTKQGLPDTKQGLIIEIIEQP